MSLMTADAPGRVQEGPSADLDTPIQAATGDCKAACAAIPLDLETGPPIECTNLVRSNLAPIEGECVPNFEEMGSQIRANYEFAIGFDNRTIRALAETRPFLAEARRWPVQFKALSRARGIKGGRLETMVIRWFRSDTDIGRTNVNRWADALMWMMERCPAERASVAVADALKIGGLTKIADLWRATEKAKTRNLAAVAEPPDLVAEADAIIEGLEPDRIEPVPADYQPQFERGEEDSVGISVWRKRPGCPREYYDIRRNDKLFRRTLKELRECR
jgi:hypothetical protein